MSGEHRLVQRLRRALDERFEPRPRRVLVGYSGGADSLALLASLQNLANQGVVEILVGHVDHGVRAGSASDADAVTANARELGVACEIRRVPSYRLTLHRGVGREEALRRERYWLLAEVAREHRCDVVCLAHHRQDQAETVLLHLLRGAGIRGASGMQAETAMVVPWWSEPAPARESYEIKVWRPLLAVPESELREFAESLGLPIVEDSSNADTTYRRNALRHEVLPLLETVSPGATAGLARYATLAGEDSAYLDGLALDAMEQMRPVDSLDRVWLMALPLPIRRRVLQFWIAAHAPTGLEVSLNRLDEVLKVAASPGPVRTVQLGLGCAIEVSRFHVRVDVAG